MKSLKEAQAMRTASHVIHTSTAKEDKEILV